ncbi:MAG: trans-2-enoyl-CoA reductase, partial [Gammaproteobacteria bacterium]|nr:trans-2-enoyl-CoA reductase [Gammaproteobacteria bacterium]
MIIEPKTRGFICTTAHPVGCQAQVKQQIDYVKAQKPLSGAKNVLVIGASTGYGLASLITAHFGMKANTLAVFFEKAATDKRTASAGWYNIAAVEKASHQDALVMSINGDAFSHEIKQQTIDAAKKHFGPIDLVIYSLASPRRIDPNTGETYNSVLKTCGQPFHNKSIDPLSGKMMDVTIPPATADEIKGTVKVMGGEDWAMWIDALEKANVLAKGVKTVAYSYIGPELTFPIYREGTIGQAKEDLEKTAAKLSQQLSSLQGHAYVSVNKAVVTQSSAAIPIVPLYISILFKVMKEQKRHEDCIQQIYRLFNECLYRTDAKIPIDEKGRIRIDDWEMEPSVQAAVAKLWPQITEENVMKLTDLAGYRRAFFNLFGFETEGVDYEKDVDPAIEVSSIE